MADSRVRLPFEFECPDCPYGSTTEVTRKDISDLPPMIAGPTLRQTVNEVLHSKGWWQINGQKMCPECVGDVEGIGARSSDTPTERRQSHE